MERSLRPIEPFVHLTQEATLDALGHTLAWSRIEAVLNAVGVVEQRARKPTVLNSGAPSIRFAQYLNNCITGTTVRLPRASAGDDHRANALAPH